MPITGGKVIYERTVQVRQFEPRHVHVEIAFEVGDKEVLSELLDEAKEICKQECLDLVNQRER